MQKSAVKVLHMWPKNYRSISLEYFRDKSFQALFFAQPRIFEELIAFIN